MERTPGTRQDSDAAYVQQLGKVLRRRDVAALREFLVKSANERDDPGEAAEITGMPEADLETRMHKMITARRDLADLYEESSRWLSERGHRPVK